MRKANEGEQKFAYVLVADGLICRSLWNTTIRTLFQEAIKWVYWDNVTRQVSLIFNAVVWRNIPFKIHIGDAFVLHTFHLLSVRFALDVAFVC